MQVVISMCTTTRQWRDVVKAHLGGWDIFAAQTAKSVVSCNDGSAVNRSDSGSEKTSMSASLCMISVLLRPLRVSFRPFTYLFADQFGMLLTIFTVVFPGGFALFLREYTDFWMSDSIGAVVRSHFFAMSDIPIMAGGSPPFLVRLIPGVRTLPRLLAVSGGIFERLCIVALSILHMLCLSLYSSFFSMVGVVGREVRLPILGVVPLTQQITSGGVDA